MLDKGKYPSFVARRSVASEDIISSNKEFDVLVEVSFLYAGNVDFVFLQKDLQCLLLFLDSFRIPLHRSEGCCGSSCLTSHFTLLPPGSQVHRAASLLGGPP